MINNTPPQSQISNAPIDKETSDTIYALRFLLAIFVVIFHAYTPANSLPILFNFTQTFFSQFFFVSCAVPLFFVFSGYLLFIKPINSFSDYKIMLVKKIKVVLLPYFLWHIILLLYDGITNVVGFTRAEFFDKPLLEYSNFFFGFPKKIIYNPGIGQFWYLRDLMLMFILAPIISVMIKKVPVAYFSFSFLFYIASFLPSIYWGRALFYFGLGCFAAQKKISITQLKIKIKDLSIAYALILILQCIEFFSTLRFNLLFYANIIIGSILILKIGERFSKNEKLFPALKKLSSYSFWIFAVHTPFVKDILLSRIFELLPPLDEKFFLLYFIIIFATILLSLGSGILCKKFFPKLFAILCGGRIDKKNKSNPPAKHLT